MEPFNVLAMPQIREIINSCEDKVAGSLQPAVDQIVNLCLSLDLAYRKNILARHCGIHPESRGQTGVDPVNAQDLTKQKIPAGVLRVQTRKANGFRKG